MDISDLKEKIKSSAVNSRGRRLYTPELQTAILRAVDSSGLPVSKFCSEIGLSASSVHSMRSRRRKKKGKFVAVKIKQKEEEIVRPSFWQLQGPRGLLVTCRSVAEVADLWRALC